MVREGEDVTAKSRRLAKDIAQEAGGGRPPIHDEPHGPVTEGYRPHYHLWDRSGGHVFYSFAAALTFSNYAQGQGPVLEGSAFVLNFFNPLSLPKDLLDIYGEFFGQCEENGAEPDTATTSVSAVII